MDSHIYTPLIFLRRGLLDDLPGHTQIFPGHEYALENLRFAAFISPDAAAVQKQLTHCKQQRLERLPVLSSSLTQECQFNPFFRLLQSPVFVQHILQWGADHQITADETAFSSQQIRAMAVLRKMKNSNAHRAGKESKL